MKLYFAFTILVLGFAVPAQARDSLEQAKIEFLISSIDNMRGAVFIRNGKPYDAKKAAEHLRGKLDYAGERIKTANQFIDECATASWLSKRRYSIRFSDGHIQDSSAYLHTRLKEYDSLKASHQHKSSPD